MGLTDLFSLEGRTALVTGGGSGIGAMIARGFLMAGAKVFITGRSPEKIEAKAAELREFGDCVGIAAEVGDAAGREALVAAILQQAPELSILVNNAGTAEYAPFAEYTEAQWDRVFEVNLKAAFFLSQSLMDRLLANASAARPSHIINVSSTAGLVPMIGPVAAYGPSKAGLHHLTRGLARMLASKHVRVNVIAPGPFPSNLTQSMMDDPEANARMIGTVPAGRWGDENDMAALAVAVASSRFLVGQVIALDGGNELVA